MADWIAPRLGPFGGQVSSVVPRGFPASARVLHPVRDHDGEPATWSAVCARTGRVAHALMQWRSISSPGVEDGTGRSASGGMPWDGDEPLVGDLEPQTLAALCRILAGHTDPAVDCFFARRLHHPGRDYLLFSGPLEAAMDLGHWPSQDWFVPQSPSLIWPTDNSWCVATEVDFDSTLIAGDYHLIDAVLGAEDLEATPIEPGDCLDSRGDTVNV
ncbi:MAG TPA: hypothetical protein VF317_03460 [Dermatophilaceae bacterium]